jgi:hypothetical protein
MRLFIAFTLQYLKRLAILLPIPALFVFLTPGDLGPKIIGVVGGAVALVFVQSLEWTVQHERERERDNPPLHSWSTPHNDSSTDP